MKKILLSIGSAVSLLAPIAGVISCGPSQGSSAWKGHAVPTKDSKQFKDFHFEVKTQSTMTNEKLTSLRGKEAEKVAKTMTDIWNKKYPNNKRTIKFTITTNDNTSTIAQRLDTGAIAGAMLTPSFFGQYAEARKKGDKLSKARKYGIFPALVTGRKPILIGKNQPDKPDAKLADVTKYFNEKYLHAKDPNWWKSQTSSTMATEPIKFNDLYYDKATDAQMIEYYRGVILIAGEEPEITAIEKAWKNKNFEAFKSHTLLFQKPTSVSGFQYPQLMLKEWFGKEAFKSIKQQTFKDPTHVKSGQSGMMARIGGVGHIGFTYLKDFVKNQKTVSALNGQILKVLTVTKPILTDGIGLSGVLSDKERAVFKEAFKKLIKDKTTKDWALWAIYGAKAWHDYNQTEAIDLANKLNS